MRGASLRGAQLDAAHLGGANLSGADLCAASLKDAEIDGADLTGANLADAIVGGFDFAHDWRSTTASPARGLTQRQLDQAKADPTSPPILDGVIDPETNKPLVWNGHVA